MPDDQPPQAEPFERRGPELTESGEPFRHVLAARAALVGNLSRDLRTPLILLLGPLENILDSPASLLAPGSRSALDAVRRNAVSLMHLVDTLPELHPLEHYGGRVERPGCDLASFTAELVDYFRPACDAAGLRLIADCPPIPGHDSVDRDAWEKVVLNLVAHAFHSTTEGTIEVRVKARDEHVELTVSGAAIAELELPYIFERLDCRSASAAAGSVAANVGLPFVRDLVKLHNGSIDVHSTGGTGTTFIVRLPLDARASAALASEAHRQPRSPDAQSTTHAQAVAAHAPSTGRGHVVVAEDHDETRDYLCGVLSAADFSVDAVADGQAALQRCRARPPDALVSDVVMPGLDGFDLIDRLRADERTAAVPVLLLSARGGEDSRIEGIAAGADDYLVKPLSRRELVARVEGAVRLGRLRREMARREQADLDALFSLAPDGVLVVGQNETILAANEQAGNLFGYTMQELVRLQVAALMPDIDRSAQIAPQHAHKDASRTRGVSRLRELRGMRSDGTEFSAEVALGPLLFKTQPCTIAIVRDITARKKLEAERAEQDQRFRDLSRRLVDVQEEERRQLSTELHDRTSPQLAAIQINMKLLAESLRGRDTEDVRAVLDDTVHLIQETTIGIREISSNLRPSVLDDGGLLPAVQAYAQQFTQRTGIVVQLQTPGAAANALPAAVQSSLFRILQEALTNCVKHASANKVLIRLTTGDSHLVSLTIADDGTGFDLEVQSKRGLGLLTMRERAEFMGGRFTVDTTPGGGTRIQVVV